MSDGNFGQTDNKEQWTAEDGGAQYGEHSFEEMELSLTIKDAALIEALEAYPDARKQHDFAVTALRIGVLVLKQAQGQIDAKSVRDEGEKMMLNLKSALEQHHKTVSSEVGVQLKEYFDPNSGRFNERVQRLVSKDGELQTLLREQIGQEDSQLVRTLSAHLGEDSPLVTMLDPERSNGFVAGLKDKVSEALEDQREKIVSEFSLDSEESALSRLVAHIKGSNEEIVKEFSLDTEDGALSRLIKRVESANEEIAKQFSLDEDESALARMRKQLFAVLEDHQEERRKVEIEIKTALAAMTARKEEKSKGVRHGADFEEAMHEHLNDRSQASGDIASHKGNTTGQIKNCKIGDVVVELGPEHRAAGAKLVFEAKEDASYNLEKALKEIDTARKNRDAIVGIFVFSKKTAPEDLDLMRCYGHDIVIVWDAEDPSSDLVLDAALFSARAMASIMTLQSDDDDVDMEAVKRAILDVEKQIKNLDEIVKFSETVKNTGGKIKDKALRLKEVIRSNLVSLSDQLNLKLID